MGVFERRAAAREAEALRVKQAIAEELAERANAFKEIEVGAKDVLAGIRDVLESEARQANDDGYRASVSSVRIEEPPKIGARLSFEARSPVMGIVDENTYTLDVFVGRDAMVEISSEKLSRQGEVDRVLPVEKLGEIGTWPFVEKIEAYLNRLIDKVDKRGA